MKSPWKSGLAAAAIAVCLSSSPVLAAGTMSDGWITTKAKVGVLSNVGTDGTDINVDTVRGRVTLHGTVPNQSDKQAAEAAARKVSGVKEVKNLLEVVPPADSKRVAESDASVKDAVAKALSDDKTLAQSRITVQSVNKGTVLLAGSAQSLLEHLRAIEDARAVPGVLKVASEVKSPDAKADAAIWQKIDAAGAGASASVGAGAAVDEEGAGAKAAAAAGSLKNQAAGALATTKEAAGSAVSSTGKAVNALSGSTKDAYITTAAKARLAANPVTPASEINVDTANGIVTLFGSVPTEKAKAAAEKEVKQVSGVERVRNELEVLNERKASF